MACGQNERGRRLDARYLRVKNWADKQHYKDRMPPWIKLYNTIIGSDDRFGFLPEHEQWQLVRIWLIASRSSAFCLDENGRRVPVVPDDELALRRSIQTLRKIPLAKFIRDGWLVPVAASELLVDDASAVLAPCLHDASAEASALLEVEEQRFREEQDQVLYARETIDAALRGAA